MLPLSKFHELSILIRQLLAGGSRVGECLFRLKDGDDRVSFSPVHFTNCMNLYCLRSFGPSKSMPLYDHIITDGSLLGRRHRVIICEPSTKGFASQIHFPRKEI